MSTACRHFPVSVQIPAYGIAVEESVHHPSFLMDWRVDGFEKFIFVFSGEGWLHYEEQSLPLQAATVCAVPSATRHRLEDASGAPLALYLICLDLQRVAFRGLAEKAIRTLDKQSMQRWPSSGHDTIRQILYEQTACRMAYREYIAGLISALLVRLVREAEMEVTARNSLERVHAYIRQMTQDFYRPQSLDEAARTCGLSRRRFSELFREASGQSWNDRLIDLRIGHACQLLKRSSRSIQSVAFECGFEDLAHFYRTFRRRMSSTPVQFRAN
jgi:AraC family L-rhamnose operon regulatory protein RhaS